MYCEKEKTTPIELLKAASSKEFRDHFLDFVQTMEKQGKAGSYIERFRKVLSSWLLHNNVDVKLKVNIKGRTETPTLQNERIPTVEELSKILRMASPRARVSISLMAFSGLRPESLGDHFGTDGIRLRDFQEGKLTEEGLTFSKLPTILTIRHPISKARHQYFTFEGDRSAQARDNSLAKNSISDETSDTQTGKQDSAIQFLFARPVDLF